MPINYWYLFFIKTTVELKGKQLRFDKALDLMNQWNFELTYVYVHTLFLSYTSSLRA